MGNRVFKRVLAVCLAMVLMVSSSLAVMAAETTSPGGGDVIPDAVIPTRSTQIVIKSNSIEVKYTQKNAVKYKVQYKSTNGTWDHCKTFYTRDLSQVIAGLARGGEYDIRVCGINKKGKAGEYCKEANRFFRSCSAKVTAHRSNFNVKVTNPLTSLDKGAKLGFKVAWSTDKNFKSYQSKIVYGTTLNVNIGAKSGKTYYVRVAPIAVSNGKIYQGVNNCTHTIVVK